MDVYEIRTNTKELLYKGEDYTLAVQSYYDFQEEAENDINSNLFGLEIIGYVNGMKDKDLYEKGGKLTSGPSYKKGDAVSHGGKVYRVISVLRDSDNYFHYRISSDKTDMLVVKESELKSAKEHHELKIRSSANNMSKLLVVDNYAKTEADSLREDEMYEDDKKASIYVKEIESFINRNNYPKRMSMSSFKELEKGNKHLLNNALALLGRYGPEMANTYKDAYKESKNMYLNPKIITSGNKEKTYKEKIAILEMLQKDMKKDLSATPKDLLKMEIRIEMLKEKSSEKFSKGGVLGYTLDINKIILNDKDRAIEIEQDSLLRGIDVRRSGKIVTVRDFDKIDDVIELLKYNLSFAYPQAKLNFKKGGELTYKQKYNKKYDYPKNEGHSLAEISKDTGVSKKGLQKIYNKGVGAYKTNPQSVRPNVKSPEQWAQARVYSSVMGGKAAKVDAKELKMAKGGKTDLTLQRDLKKIKESSSFSKLRPYIRDGKIIIESGYEVYDKTADSGTGAYVEYPEFESSKEIVEALKDVKGRDNKYRITLEKHEEEEPEDSNVEYIAYYYYLTPIGSYAEGGMIDYFEEYELLQKEYPKIYNLIMEQGELESYEDTERLLNKLNSMGWTFDYGLDNSPFNLRPFAPKMNWPSYAKGGNAMSWGVETRELADSFTFEELEKLLKDKKISKADYNGAKGYLQSWIDMHPTYLPQRDLTSPKRQKIRDRYEKGGALSEEFKFDKNFVVYVPSTSDVSDKISPKELDDRVNEVKQYVANTFGGYTETETEGGYKSSKGDIVEEDVVKVSVFSKNKDWKDKEYEVVKKAKEWAKEWGQEAIGFEYEGDLYYIDGDGKMERGGLMKTIQIDPEARELEPGETLPMYEGKTAELNQRSVLENIRELRKDPKTFWSEQMEGFKDNRQSAYRLVEDKKAKVNKYVSPEEQELIGAAITKRIKKSWGGTIDLPRGTGWGKYKKGKRILKIKDLKEGSNYLAYSDQFNAKNIVYIIPEGKSELNPPGSSMFTDKKVFAYVQPEHLKRARSPFDVPMVISEDQLQDSYANYNFYEMQEKEETRRPIRIKRGRDHREGLRKTYGFKQGGLTKDKAKQILEDGEANGKALTEKQKRYFGAIAGEGEYGLGGFLTGAILGAVGGVYVTNTISKTTKKREAEGKKAKAPKYLYKHPLWDNSIYKYLKKKKTSNKEIEKLWNKGLQNLPEYLKKRNKLKQSIK